MAQHGMESFTFDVEQDRKLDQIMAGERYGAPTNPEGMTTDTIDRQAQVEQALTDTAIEDARAGQPPLGEIDYLKKRLGEQGNEIGELRRRAAEADLLRARLEYMERNPPPPQRAPVNPASVDLFADIPQDQSYMSSVERARINQVLVALAQGVQGEINNLRAETVYHAVRASSGVSEADEAEAIRSHPWINSLSGKDRASAIVEMVQSKNRANGAPQRNATSEARSRAREVAYVEPSSRVSESEGDTALEGAQEKLLREIRAGKFKTSEEVRQAMRRAGIPSMDSENRRY